MTFNKYKQILKKEHSEKALLKHLEECDEYPQLVYLVYERLYLVTKKIKYLEQASLISISIDEIYVSKFLKNKIHSLNNKSSCVLSVAGLLFLNKQNLDKAGVYFRKALKVFTFYSAIGKFASKFYIGLGLLIIGNEIERKKGWKMLKTCEKSVYFNLFKSNYYEILAIYSVMLMDKPKFGLYYALQCNDEIKNLAFGLYNFRIKKYSLSQMYLLASAKNYALKNGKLDAENLQTTKLYTAIIAYYLGQIFLYGLGTTKDEEIGLGYLKISLNLSYADAAFQIGEYYYELHQIENAKVYFQKGIDLNETRCMMRMASILYHYDPSSDYSESFLLLNRAKDFGDARAYYELGNCFLYQSRTNPLNSDINLTRAKNYFEEAFKNGVKEAKDIIDIIDEQFKKNLNQHSASVIRELIKIDTPEKLYKKSYDLVTKKFENRIEKPNDTELGYFVIGIFDAIINLKYQKDFSLPILSLEKGFSIILKDRIVRKYKDYLWKNNLEKEEFYFSTAKKDSINKGEIFFTLDMFKKCINRKNNVTGKYYFKDFIEHEYSLNDNDATKFIQKLSKGIEKIKPIRNDAAHGYKTTLESFEQCLDILLFEEKIAIQIFKK